MTFHTSTRCLVRKKEKSCVSKAGQAGGPSEGVGVRSLARGDEKWQARGPVCVETAAGPDEEGGLREKKGQRTGGRGAQSVFADAREWYWWESGVLGSGRGNFTSEILE